MWWPSTLTATAPPKNREIEATNSTVAAAEPDQQGVDPDYPAFIVIDDDCDEELALAEDRSAVVIAD